MTTNSKPILFIDFDGTLCFDRYWRSLQGEMFAVVQQTLFGDDNTLVVEWMLGKKTAEEVNRLLAKKLGVPFDQLWEVFVDDCENMKVNIKTLESLNLLRSRYTVILMTTNMDSFTRFTVPALELDRYFDDIVNSADVGLLKSEPAGRIFLDSLQKHQGDIATSILIDDSPRALDVFSSLGGTVYPVTREFSIDYYLTLLSREG